MVERHGFWVVDTYRCPKAFQGAAVTRKHKIEWFTDDGPGLDRFGWVLALSALSITVLSLIDLDDVGSSYRAEVGWIVVMISVGATLIASLRASGVARKPRRIAEVIVFIVVVASLVAVALGFVSSDANMVFAGAARPSITWTLLAVVSPPLVLRRVMKQSTITMATLAGALSVYLLLALAFGYGFLSMEGWTSGSFFGQAESTSSFMYFSLVTITTVGYGDLSPVSDLGRFLASAEAVLGQVLLVTVVARLVSLYSRTNALDNGSTQTVGDAAIE